MTYYRRWVNCCALLSSLFGACRRSWTSRPQSWPRPLAGSRWRWSSSSWGDTWWWCLWHDEHVSVARTRNWRSLPVGTRDGLIWLIHSFIDSFSEWVIDWLQIHSFIHSIDWLVDKMIGWLTDGLINWLVGSLIDWFIHSFVEGLYWIAPPTAQGHLMASR